MSYRVYRITGGNSPYAELIGTFAYQGSALAFCKSPECQRANAITDASIGQSLFATDDSGAVICEYPFKWTA